MRLPSSPVAEPADPATADPYRAWKQLGLLLLALAWIGLGLAGHDPWKYEDATMFGVSWEMNQRGDYVLPRLAGEVYLPHPPLVPVLAALTQELFAPPLEPFNAARIAVGLLLGLTLLFSALATAELAGSTRAWLPVLILIGSVGMWDRGHVLSGQLGLTTGLAVALYGQALALRRAIPGGALLGAGAAVAFLSNGFGGPAWLAIAAAILVVLGPSFRTRHYALALLVALVVALMLAAPWVIALYERDPALVDAWLSAESPGKYVA